MLRRLRAIGLGMMADFGPLIAVWHAGTVSTA